ncbi:MAG: hypothetical protein ACRCU1_11545 [Alsobacter sp.]
MDIENDHQTESTESPAETTGDPTRDDLIAAAREATAATAEDPTSPAADTHAAATETGAPAAADDPEAKLAALMAKREASHSKRIEADDYFEKQKTAGETLKQQIIDEARAEAKRILAAELETERAKFRANPVAAAQALAGGNVDDFVQQVLRHGTPEAAAQAAAEAKHAQEMEALRAEAREGKTAKETVDQFLQHQRMQHVESVKTQFLTEHASPEKAPYMHARWDPEEVFSRCNEQTIEWQMEGLKLGIDFDRATVAAYLEKQSRDRYQRQPGLTPAQQSGAGAPTKGPGVAPKFAANGTRTIPVASTSERRAAPKPFNELSSAEQREDLVRVAREAMRQTGKV